MPLGRSLYRCLLLALLLGPVATVRAEPTDALPGVESFFANPVLGAARLSPGGRYLAARSGGPGRRDFLAVVDLQTNATTVVAAHRDADIDRFEWVNDDRLMYSLTDRQAAPGEIAFAPGLFAVERDGTRHIQLAARRATSLVALNMPPNTREKLQPWNTWMLSQAGAQDSEFVYVQRPEFERNGELIQVNLMRLNTSTGTAQPVSRPGPVQGWMLDHLGEPRLAFASRDGAWFIHYRDPATLAWRKLASFREYGQGSDGFVPLGFGPDGKLYVIAHRGKDTSALHTFDFATGTVHPQPVVVTEGYDFNGRLVVGDARVLGVRYRTDAESTVWFDPAMKALQQKVDELLPHTINLLTPATRGDLSRLLVESYSDTMPRTYGLFDAAKGIVIKVGASQPRIDPDRMGRQQGVRYQARDGLSVPALLTLPRNGEGKLPLVVLVHGGPWVRGSTWGWRAAPQFLASRGYAVLEPEFRGGTGLGARHFGAGWKQWGLAMQDDLADGVRWAVAQGIADPKRVCIAGGDYGGYASLMGLVKDPGLYRCAVSWSAPTDIELMYTGTWYARDDLPEQWKQYGMPELVGDRVRDAAQLTASSPLAQAARITRPLLLAHGGADRRVPIYHGKRLRDAVRSADGQVEWVEYPEEGHGWKLEQTRYDFWSRVEKFLDKHIGKGALPE
jgi:dipeptidyl aminopeptidase/acylaminoacyl peptidase